MAAAGLTFCNRNSSRWAALFMRSSKRPTHALNRTWAKTSGMAVTRPSAVANRARPMSPAWSAPSAAAVDVLDLREGADHADDRAEQADHGGDLGDGQDGRQQEVEVGQDLQLDDVGHGPAHGGEALLVRPPGRRRRAGAG